MHLLYKAMDLKTPSKSRTLKFKVERIFLFQFSVLVCMGTGENRTITAKDLDDVARIFIINS
jgi:hypothetical protein